MFSKLHDVIALGAGKRLEIEMSKKIASRHAGRLVVLAMPPCIAQSVLPESPFPDPATGRTWMVWRVWNGGSQPSDPMSKYTTDKDAHGPG